MTEPARHRQTGSRVDRLREKWRRTLSVLRAPRIVIEVFGGAEAREAYVTFTSRHPRMKVTSYKRWGVALIRLPESHADYTVGHPRWVLRQKLRLATKHGYRYSVVPPRDWLDDVLEINRSAPTRQGRAMAESYTDRESVLRAFDGQDAMHAILSADGHLRAYATTLPIGDAVVFTLILGHADHLEYGTMYLLVSEVVRACIDGRGASGAPRWLMYDTYWGGSRGLTFFKERAGFRPFTVDWRWIEREAT